MSGRAGRDLILQKTRYSVSVSLSTYFITNVASLQSVTHEIVFVCNNYTVF